ncbi:MAG: sarcosine oxidase subunit delta [Rubrivivax sp.]
MMQLRCPWCGPRPENEFDCGGTTGIARPPLDCDDETWAQYLFFRANPKGAHAERWRHTFGCGQWFNLVRDTVSHRTGEPFGIVEPPPAGALP